MEIGQIVIYNTTENERKQMIASGIKSRETLPAIVVHVIDSNTVHLQVFLDGEEGLMYISPSHQGDEEGQWDIIPSSV